MSAILELQKTEALLFKYGSGTGTNLSTLRSSKERLKGGGKSSGPVSFMRAFDGWAAVVKSGGKTRRAAKMQILNIDHPDIVEFIGCKVAEEKKAWTLIDAGFDGGFAVPGGAYDSVAFQNVNTSVRVSDEFMRAVERESTVQDIFEVYLQAWKFGLKSVALYRDGSKRVQPLNTERGQKIQPGFPQRRRLNNERNAITHKFNISGFEGYITVGLFEDGSPGEIFIVAAKEGSTLSGTLDALATSVSLALQYGVPLSALVKKFSHVRFEPSGFTGSRAIPFAKSIVDYIFRWLAIRFMSLEEQRGLGLSLDKDTVNTAATGEQSLKNVQVATFQNSEDAPPCLTCGSSLMVRQAGC